MIRIDKSKANVPAILRAGNKGEIATQELIQLYDGGRRDFKPTDFSSVIYGNKTVKSLLLVIQHGKCCFCEQKRPHGREGDVEHFRPKTGFQIDRTASLQKPGYYWLAYDFENLFYTCKVCNQEYKKNFFPLVDETKRALSHKDDWKNEESLILHPGLDDPSDHIEFVEEIAKPKAGSSKGKVTIQLVGLNDPKLAEERLKYLKPLKILSAFAREGHKESQDYFKEIGKDYHLFSLMVRCNFPDLV
ncbi:MAG: hypothetical protein U0X91_27180 [Spirosomataceae bacterium]